MIAPITALQRIGRETVVKVAGDQIDPKFVQLPNYTGLGTTPGVVSGRAVLTPEAAVAATEPVILLRHETDPDDIAGMYAAAGLLTRTGGSTCHAAVVARSINKPCVVGCTSLPSDLTTLEGQRLTIDGLTGRVWVGVEVPVIPGSDAPLARLAATLNPNTPIFMSPDAAAELLTGPARTARMVVRADDLFAASNETKERMLSASAYTVENMHLMVLVDELDSPGDAAAALTALTPTKEAREFDPKDLDFLAKLPCPLTIAGSQQSVAAVVAVRPKVNKLVPPSTVFQMVESRIALPSPALAKSAGGVKSMTRLLADLATAGYSTVLLAATPAEYSLLEALERAQPRE